jgi:hypothetical protein
MPEPEMWRPLDKADRLRTAHVAGVARHSSYQGEPLQEAATDRLGSGKTSTMRDPRTR